MRTKPLYLLPLALLAAAPAAHADPVADFETGTAAFVETATVDLGNGPRTSTGSGALTKRERSLDLVVKASDFGVELPISLHLRGTSLRDGTIQYVVEESYEPAVKLGAGHSLKGVSGRMVMRAVPLQGTERPAVGNIRLILAKASSLVARTDLGEVAIAIDQLAIQGGVVQPPLADLKDATGTSICSDRVATYHDFTVALADLATASSAVVDLGVPRGAGVHVPIGVGVRAGRQSATVTARIDPDFVGRVRLTAAAGGVERALDIAVRPSGECPRR
jgi:hypothetical protein